jgi:RNA polymerase sigma-70 factor, ECF subfamily
MGSSDEASRAAQRRYASAAAARPDLRLADEAAFVARLVAATAGTADPAHALEALHVEDLLVAQAAVAGDAAAIVEIDRRLRDQATAVVRGLGESRGFADDLESELRTHVLAARDAAVSRLDTYAGLGPLDGWLRVIATRLAHQARKHAARTATAPLDDLAGGALELDYLKAAYRGHFETAFRAALRELDARQRTLIALHYGDGVGVERLGQMYRVHASTISRWISAARQRLFEATRDAVRAALGIDAAEFAELMELVRSRLDVTISLFVRPAP